MKNLLLLCLFAISFTFISCGGDDVSCDEQAIVNDLNPLINDINNALTAYITDQSQSNCDAYKDALQNYIDRLRDYQSCANELGQGASFQSDLDQAEADLATLVC